MRSTLIATCTALALALGGAAWLFDGGLPQIIWMTGLIACGTPLVVRTAAGALRGHYAADLVASLAIVTAVLLAQPIAGLIVVLMQSGGEALERYAEGRASAAVRELEAAAPRIAHRLAGGSIEDIDVASLVIGDVLLIRPGELVPCDAVVESGESHVDASTLTGEAAPLHAVAGAALMSGSANGEGALTVRATRTSSESRYARIVELVRSAQASKAPIQRVADRYAVWFTPLTLLVCALAYVASNDPLRVLAVLVVATPCPLILATPVAVVGGINRAARRHIIVRDGGALERLASVDVAALDKTGTLTYGTPQLSRVTATAAAGPAEVLRLAASLELASGHLLGRAVIDAALAAGTALVQPTLVRERAGRGISGMVDGRTVLVGARSLVLEQHPDLAAACARSADGATGLHAYVVVAGELAGILHFADRVRTGVHALLDELHALGLQRTLLLSGDHADHVRALADRMGIAEAHAELLPEDKVAIVRRLLKEGHRVLMVGDGVNDAPALSSATVGIALAGHGGGITAEAADIVILIDEPARVAEAVHIARRTLRIARQSIGVGLGLSGVAMLFAAAGYIPPTVGALLQEGIDVAVIFNALRAAVPVAARGDSRLAASGRKAWPYRVQLERPSAR
ncbi:MAG TPA: heavy metal translocating P-type ATPase [Longimicrobiales bacterium]|nr:heavy metal translocating P-type ATPase [Longimicrobiales bacterium]